jgi:ABC-2 type transport system permease protein/sodium transport system permease protein
MKENPASEGPPPVTLSPRHLVTLSSVGRLLRLTRKELSESLRDRRTLLTLVLMPLLLYPLLTIAFQQLMLSRRTEEAPAYRLGFVSRDEAESLMRYWARGRAHLAERHTPAGRGGQAPTLSAHLAPLPELQPFLPDDLEDAVRRGAVDVGVRLRPPGAFLADPRRLLHVDCDLLYRTGSQRGREAALHLELLTADANAALVGRGMRNLRIPQRGDPVRAHALLVANEAGGRGSMVPVLVPLVLILMTMTGAVYPAIDLTAGERERGTLEILVAAPIPRMVVLLAKYAAVLTVALLTALVNLGSMTLTLRVTGIEAALFGAPLGPLVLLQIFGLLLLFASFFSAVLLTLTSFARSFKEAQAYLIPLMLLCLLPGMMALFPGLGLNGPLAVVPLLNIVLLARDLLGGVASVAAAGIVVATTLIYALAAVAVAARIFGTEAVLTSEVSGWGDLFCRPTRWRPVAEPAGALLCLAVMFPAYFLLTTGLARVEGLDVSTRLGLSALVAAVLFGGFPLAAAWLGRVRLGTALRLRAPSWQACAAALLLGACLWPFAHEIALLLRQAGIETMHRETAERLRDFLQECRAYPVVLMVAVMALVPAVFEELFFRGYLFTALLGQGERPGRAIVGSAALFAVFHLLVRDSLAVERLVPSLLLGLVLAWLCYRSGSIVPGMILHALHNGLLVLLAYYEPELTARGWVPSAEDHLPAWLLGPAAAGAALGLLWVWRLRSR